MYILNIASAIKKKKMSVNEIRYLISENYYKHIEFSKENSCYSIKHLNIFFFLQLKYLNKIADLSNAKEQYQSFISKKNKISQIVKNNY